MDRNSNIDQLRVFAFVAVAIAHVNSRSLFGQESAVFWTLDELARFAVPVFFLISGYFSRFDEPGLGSFLRKRALRLLPAYGAWFLVYNSVAIYRAVTTVDIREMAKLAGHFVVDGGVGFHLWFLPGLFIGLGIVYVLLRNLPRQALAIALSLYVVAVAIHAQFWSDVEIPAFRLLSRNGFLEAPVFILVGHLLRNPPPWSQGAAPIIGLLAGGAALHLAEAWATFRGFDSGHDVTFGVLLLAVGVFLAAMRWQGRMPWVAALARFTLGAYAAHVLFLDASTWMFAGQGSAALGMALLVAIVALSFALAFSLSRVPYLRRTVV